MLNTTVTIIKLSTTQPILQKLRERAHAALSNSHHQGETATRLSFFGPSIKSEADELSTLGGMTRLVSRRSPSSPSYSGSSPSSQPASPPPPHSAAHDGPRFADAANAAPWQHYSHIQQQTYPDHAPSPYQMQQDHQPQMDVSLMYNAAQVPLEAMPDYYGYPTNGGYNMQLLQSPDESASPPQHYLPVDSWQNFISQYK